MARRRRAADTVRANYKRAYENNKASFLARNAEWRREHWDNVYEQRIKSGSAQRSRKKWYHNRGKHDLQYVLSERLRSRVRNVLQGRAKAGSTLALTGCTLDDLIKHLERRFTPYMTWQNYGSYWHIDHIRPCASFDLSNRTEQLECFHYTNLQPLEGIENIRKGAQWPNHALQRTRAAVTPTASIPPPSTILPRSRRASGACC